MAKCQCGCGQETKIITSTRSTRGLIKGQPYKYIWGHNTRKNKSIILKDTHGILRIEDDEVFFDLEDLELIKRFSWHIAYNPQKITKYAKTSTSPGSIFLHRMIMGFPCRSIDHINRNGLDNRKANLRLANNAIQQHNQPSQRRKNYTNFKGVYFNPKGKKIRRWSAQIRINGTLTYLGSFLTEKEAAQAYDKAVLQYWAEDPHAYTNFPKETYAKD